MKLKYDLETVDMGEEFIGVPVGEGAKEIHGVLKLNRAGKEIVDLLKTDATEDQIVDTLAAQYENARDTLAAYVRQTVAALREAALLEE